MSVSHIRPVKSMREPVGRPFQNCRQPGMADVKPYMDVLVGVFWKGLPAGSSGSNVSSPVLETLRKVR